MNRKQIETITGVSIEITKILEKDINRKRGYHRLPGSVYTESGRYLLDSEIDIVIELLWRHRTAAALLLKAMENKKHVVTAIKPLWLQLRHIHGSCEAQSGHVPLLKPA
jgi:homoserine dehydrogenase